MDFVKFHHFSLESRKEAVTGMIMFMIYSRSDLALQLPRVQFLQYRLIQI